MNRYPGMLRRLREVAISANEDDYAANESFLLPRALAETLAQEGATTVVTDVRQELLDDVAATFGRHRWAGRQYLCDVRDAPRTRAVVDEVTRAFGRVDVLVNNAGVAPTGPVETLPEEAWDLNLDVNLKGTFLMCQAAIPVMKRQRSGRIINAASFAAIVPITGASAYAASKAGVHYFTRALAGELTPVLRAVGQSDRLWKRVMPGVPEALARFRELGLQLVVVSNSDGSVERSLASAGLRPFFHAVMDSYLVGHEKPDRRFFEAALAAYGSLDAGFVDYATLTDADKKALSDEVNALAEPLSQLTATVLGV